VTEPLYDLSGLLMLNDVVNKIAEDAKPPFGPEGSIWAGMTSHALSQRLSFIMSKVDRLPK
jgi:hypothetical protein